MSRRVRKNNIVFLSFFLSIFLFKAETSFLFLLRSGNCQKKGALSPVESARILTSVRTKCLPDSDAHLKWKLHFLALLSCMVNFLSISGKGEKNGA